MKHTKQRIVCHFNYDHARFTTNVLPNMLNKLLFQETTNHVDCGGEESAAQQSSVSSTVTSVRTLKGNRNI